MRKYSPIMWERPEEIKMQTTENNPINLLSHAPILINDAYRRASLLALAFVVVLTIGWLLALTAPAALATGHDWIAFVTDDGRIAPPESVAPEMANWPTRVIPLEWRWSPKGVDVDAMFRKSPRRR